MTSEQEPDLMAFTETWLSSDISDSEVFIPGYQLSRADRLGWRSGGGVALYWKLDLKVHTVEAMCDLDGGSEILWIRVHDGFRPLIVGVIYRSPLGSGSHLIDSMRIHRGGKDCLIVGDFNAPAVDWDALHCNLSPDSFDTRLLEIVLECNLTQHVLSPTRFFPGHVPHILDLVLTPSSSDASTLAILQPLWKSDHCVVSFFWTRQLAINVQGAHRRNFWRTDPLRLKLAAGLMDWNIPHQLDLDAAWDLLCSKMMFIIDRVVPRVRKQFFSKGPPWIDREIKSPMMRRRKLWGRFKFTQTAQDYAHYKEARNLCTLRKREKRELYEQHLAEQSVLNPKKLFAYLKRSTKAGNGIPALYSSKEDTVLHDDMAKACLLASQYSSVYTTEATLVVEDTPCHSSPLEHVEITTDRVLELLLDLNSNSSLGPDGLHPLFLKEVAEFIAAPICQVFRSSLEAGRLPTKWKANVVKPMYKGGNRQDPVNYRPICLSSILRKTTERILKQALHLHLEKLDVISPAQHGFRRARSCITNLLVAREKWAQSVDAGHRLDVVF
ncbi:unnamed protein product, partial [Dicrocoelium dendriticum]